MPEFDIGHITGIISPPTVTSVTLAGLVLAGFLWNVAPRVRGFHLTVLLVAGLAFDAVMVTGRYVDDSRSWEAWFGIAILWTLYIVIAYAGIVAWRRIRREGA